MPLANCLACTLVAWVVFVALSAPLLGAENGPEQTEVIVRQPQVNAVFPQAAQPGTQTSVEISGEFLDESQQIRFESEDVSGRVLSSSFTAARIEVAIAPHAPPGARYFRLISPRGPSNLMLFRVSRWPTLNEEEPNDDLDSPKRLPVPALVSGRLSSVNDVDLFRFHAGAGERIQFNLLGARNWTPADVSLAIVDLDGRRIALDEGTLVWDPYIDHTFEHGGDYLAAVTATRLLGDRPRYDLNYQLSIGQSVFVWSLFPFGGALRTNAVLSLRGDFVNPQAAVLVSRNGIGSNGIEGRVDGRCADGTFKVSIAVDSNARPGVHELFFQEESGVSTPVRFIVGDLPEVTEAEPNDDFRQAQHLTFPITINGRLDRNGDEDWYQIRADAGQSLVFIVDAEKYGSRLDSHLTLLDAKGEIVTKNDDAKNLERPLNRDSRLDHKFEQGGEYFLKLGSLFGQGGKDYVYRLTVRSQKPSFVISIDSDRPIVERGGQGKLGINVLRQEGFEGEIKVEVSSLPAGVRARPLTISSDKDSGNLEFEADIDADSPPTEIRVYGIAIIDGKEVRQEARLPKPPFQGSGPGFNDYKAQAPLLTVIDPVLFSLESAASSATIANTVYLVRGGSVEFGVKLARRPGFTLPLVMTAENLPEGVSMGEVQIVDNGRMARVTLNAAESAPRVTVGNVVVVATSADSMQRRESSPRITLQVD